MPGERISMRKIKEILRLRYTANLSYTQIAASLKISIGVAHKVIKKAEVLGLSWPVSNDVDDERLEALIYGSNSGGSKRLRLPDYPLIHQELRRKGVTLLLLWQEYYQANASDAYGYTQFCCLYKEWKNSLKPSMRQVHKAGEKLFVDYCGATIPIIDAKMGQSSPAQIFVATLGASNYTYAEATGSQSLKDWITSHQHAFDYFGGVPTLLIPDNLKSGVTKACRYEPDINPTYADMASHYGIAVIPTRPRKPKDKAKVEVAVQVVERWILARLRHYQFFSLTQLNQAIRTLLEELNHRPMKKLSTTRTQLFLQLDKPALKPLPVIAYQYCEWRKVRAGLDYHIEIDGHYYSVPFSLAKQELEVRLAGQVLEVLHQGKRVASHPRSAILGSQTTIWEHMPKSHQKHQQWSITNLKQWAETIGTATSTVVEFLLKNHPHPEMGYRSCLGLIRLSRQYGTVRLEKAAQRVLLISAPSYRSIKSILHCSLDLQPLSPTEPPQQAANANHENIRGAAYYQQEEAHA